MAQGPNSHWNAEQAAAFTELMLGETRQYGIVFYEHDYRISGWNEGAAYLTGWSADEVIGQPTAMLFVPEDRERKIDEHEANTARIVGVAEDERWQMRKDGSRLWSSGVSIQLPGGAHGLPRFVKIFRDATHLRARMKYLENVMQDCSVQENEKNVFIGTIAHEMRNPLAPLKTGLELMKRLPGGDPRQLQPLQIMEGQIGFLERLVEDLVDLTRVQTGKMSIAYELVRLQDCVLEAIDSCRTAAQAKQLALVPVLPPLPIGIEVDPRRLLQVFVNLLNNAVKYTPEGGGSGSRPPPTRPISPAISRTTARASAPSCCPAFSRFSPRPTAPARDAERDSGSAWPWCARSCRCTREPSRCAARVRAGAANLPCAFRCGARMDRRRNRCRYRRPAKRRAGTCAHAVPPCAEPRTAGRHPVTAPLLALDASAANLASTPRV